MDNLSNATTFNISIEDRITEKIKEVKGYEKDIPAVIILMNVQTLSVVYMSERGRNILGVSLEELHEMGPAYFQRFFNEEEANEYTPYLKDLLYRNNADELVSFFQQVRPSSDHPWTWYFNGVKILMKDDNGIPLLTMIAAIPIDHHHYMISKVQRLLDENNFLRQNFKLMKSLTKREVEVLKLVANGCSTEEISNKLFLSKDTVATHRKNIKRKLGFKTNFDFTCFAQAFDLK
jgi:DNA-binding CsgD family transcriptional regulator